MKTSEVLLAARELIATPEKWTKGHYARNKRSEKVSSSDPSACRWCMLGALERVAPRHNSDIYAIIERAIGCNGFVVWQDRPKRKHAEVIEALTKAAALAAAEEQS